MEMAAQKQFFGATGESWYLALFGLPKSANGNMLNDAEFKEINDFYVYITENLNLTIIDEGSNTSYVKSYRYMDLCAPLCNINEQMQKLMDNSWLATMEYPVSQVLFYDLNIGKHVFERSYDNKTGHLIGAKFMAYYFTIFMETPLIERQIAHFEKTCCKY